MDQARLSALRSPASDQGARRLVRAVAENLHRLRLAKALSLERLAVRSGVSRAMLNQIELGRSTPTIAVVWKVAAGLGVPVADLLAQQEPSEAVLLRYGAAKLLFNAQETFSSRALFPFGPGRRATEFYEILIRPGGEERAGAHDRGTREYVTSVAGRTEITVEGEVYCLAERDTLVFRADRPHIYRNASATDEARLYLLMSCEAGA